MPNDFYAPDLAGVHDEGFGFTARAAAGVALGELGRRFPEGGLVVELGSGSGILARELTDAGYDVLGFDISPAMVRLARRQAPRARFRVGSAHDADIPSCVAVTAVGEVVNYATDRRAGLAQLGRLARRVQGALVPGGFFLFDSRGPGAGRHGVREAFHDAPGWSLRMVARERGRTLTRSHTLFRKAGSTYRRSDEEHVLRLYDPAEVAERLRRAGFRVRRLRGYGDLRFPGWTAFLATKRR